MYFSQKDPRWRDKKVGFGGLSFGAAGCAITSVANILKWNDEVKDPLEINNIAKNCGAFKVDMLSFPILAKQLGYDYLKIPKTDSMFPKIGQKVIAETNYFSKVGVPQHFFLFNPSNKKRLDPLDLNPSWEENNYPIVSYRVLNKLTYVNQSPEKGQEVNITEPIQETLKPIQTYTAIPVLDKETLTDPKNQWKQMVDDLISLIFNIIKKLWRK